MKICQACVAGRHAECGARLVESDGGDECYCSQCRPLSVPWTAMDYPREHEDAGLSYPYDLAGLRSRKGGAE